MKKSIFLVNQLTVKQSSIVDKTASLYQKSGLPGLDFSRAKKNLASF